MAIQLARMGAHVTIVARKENLLKEALLEIQVGGGGREGGREGRRETRVETEKRRGWRGNIPWSSPPPTTTTIIKNYNLPFLLLFPSQLFTNQLYHTQAACKTPSTQKIAYAVADVSVKEDCVRALKEATTKIGKVPEYVFCIAGEKIYVWRVWVVGVRWRWGK